MPKTKKKAVESSGSDSSSDSGPEDRAPAKKAKVEPSKSSKAKPDEDSEPTWQLEKKRLIKVREFRGRVFVDIREYYEGPDGDLKPGKKGISLPASQWQKLKEFIPEVDDALKKF